MKIEIRSQKPGVSGGNRFVSTDTVRRSFLVILVVVAGMLAFCGTRMAARSKTTRLPSYSLGQVVHLKAELGLDARQVAEIRTLERELAAQLSDQCGSYCAVRAELGNALLEEGTNAAVDARRLVDRMCAIQSASELATLEHIRKVSAQLTPGQRKQFLAGLMKCLCGGQGLCAGGCKGGGPQ